MEGGVWGRIARRLHLPQRGRRHSGFRQLSVPGAQAFGGRAGNRAAELPDPAPNDGDPGAEHGFGKGHPGAPAAFAARHDGQRIHAGVAGERPADGRIGVPDVDERRGEERL